jgi:EAL domain-containing protein (putative c-di-GMP-specific phosphodiesterase class I)
MTQIRQLRPLSVGFSTLCATIMMGSMPPELMPPAPAGGVFSRQELLRALARDEFVLAYQPTVNLVDQTVTGFEALARWAHPHLGLLSASRFIPLAERYGIIREIDDWVFRTACRQLATWQEDVFVSRDFRLAMNVSGTEVDGQRLVDRLIDVIDDSGVDPHGLMIEVTETSLITNVEAARHTADGLHALGVKLALDDFGIQYASFRRLHALEFDVLKIDREFVRNVDTELGCAFIRALVQLGNSLGALIIAEGVETAQQVAQLKAIGCHEGQGFRWAPGLSVGQAEQVLAHGEWPRRDPTTPWFPTFASVR